MAHHCGSHIRSVPCSQTLEEMDFERGIWSSAIFGNSDRLLHLIKQGIDVNSRDKYGFTALHYASRNGKREICEILLEHGADITAVTRNDKSTPLHRAAYNGHLDIVILLCSHSKRTANSAFVFMLDADKQTCMHAAARGKHLPVLRWLSDEYPQLIPIRDKSGRTASELLPQ